MRFFDLFRRYRSRPTSEVGVRRPLDDTPYERDPRATVLSVNTPPGQYVYVCDVQGIVHIAPDGPHQHPKVLGKGSAAMGAGTLTILTPGTVSKLDNISGTFRFPGTELPRIAEAIRKQGLSVDKDAIRVFDFGM